MIASDWITTLERESNPDQWADHDLQEVGRALDWFDDAEWQELTSSMQLRSDGFRRRLAQAQLFSDKDRAIALLEELVRAPESSVAAAAAEMLIEKGYTGTFEVRLRDAVDGHLAHAADWERPILERLRTRLVA